MIVDGITRPYCRAAGLLRFLLDGEDRREVAASSARTVQRAKQVRYPTPQETNAATPETLAIVEKGASGSGGKR